MFSKSKNQTKITKKIMALDISMCKKVFQKSQKTTSCSTYKNVFELRKRKFKRG